MDTLETDKENPTPAWDDKEMVDVNSERSRLVGTSKHAESTNAAPLSDSSSTWKLRFVNLTGLTLAFVLTGIVAYYSFFNGVKLFSFHPISMAIGWVVLMPLAINALRTGDLATSWMPLQLRSTRHWALQTLAASFVTAGFLVIVVNKINSGKSHFTTFHGIFGLVSVVFMLLTLSGGIGALYSLKLKNYLPPVYTKLIHGLAGLLTLSLGTVTIILGLFGCTVTEPSAQWFGSFVAVAVATLTVLRPAIGMYVRLRERLCYIH